MEKEIIMLGHPESLENQTTESNSLSLESFELSSNSHLSSIKSKIQAETKRMKEIEKAYATTELDLSETIRKAEDIQAKLAEIENEKNHQKIVISDLNNSLDFFTQLDFEKQKSITLQLVYSLKRRISALLANIEWQFDYYFTYFLYSPSKQNRYHSFMIKKYGPKYTDLPHQND